VNNDLQSTSVAEQALTDPNIALAVFEGSGDTRVREAILRDLLEVDDEASFPIQLTQHPYRPGISIDLQRRFDTEQWAVAPKRNLRRLATRQGAADPS
jgi:hypothetical protein